MHGLKSSEARREYPKGLKILLDFLGLPGSLEEQTIEFLERTRSNPQWCQDSIIAFLIFISKELFEKNLLLAPSRTYFRADKLFYEMYDLTTINWKRISKGLPRAKNKTEIICSTPSQPSSFGFHILTNLPLLLLLRVDQSSMVKSIRAKAAVGILSACPVKIITNSSMSGL